MANSSNPKAAVASLFVVVGCLLLSPFSTEAIGVCNGRNGNNLPSPPDVVRLYQSKGITTMRLYGPGDKASLDALQGSGITIILDVPNDQVQSLGSDASAATNWVETNVVPYASSIKYIAVGNEISPTDAAANSVPIAMKNVHDALNAKQLGDQIKVSTSIKMDLLSVSSPPSQGQFGDTNYITPIVQFLTSNDSPLLVNVYPYFAYKDNKDKISLDYALFKSTTPVVTDDNNLSYDNLFDAMVDSVYAALSKVDGGNTKIVVSETGWPSQGEDSATVDNAGTYYRNLISHVGKGTPLKPGPIETYLFAMFDENQKQGDETERHFGLFNPDQTPKYGDLNFS